VAWGGWGGAGPGVVGGWWGGGGLVGGGGCGVWRGGGGGVWGGWGGGGGGGVGNTGKFHPIKILVRRYCTTVVHVPPVGTADKECQIIMALDQNRRL